MKGLSIRAVLKDMLGKVLPGGKKNKQVETSLIEEFLYPKYGPGQLWETVADEVEAMGGRLLKGCRVTGFPHPPARRKPYRRAIRAGGGA